MKKITLITIFILFVVSILSINFIRVKADSSTPQTQPQIIFFDKDKVDVRWENVPDGYVNTTGHIWIWEVNGKWNQRIDLIWQGKIDNTGVWKGVTPRVPSVDNYVLKDGMLIWYSYEYTMIPQVTTMIDNPALYMPILMR